MIFFFFFLPCPDVQFAAVDDTRQLKEDRKPATNPDSITGGDVHVITGVFSQSLDDNNNNKRSQIENQDVHNGRKPTGQKSVLVTCGLSATYLAQCRMSLMASMLVSGKAALHTNSDKHLTASWNESIAAAKCSLKVFAGKKEQFSGKREISILQINNSIFGTHTHAVHKCVRNSPTPTQW